MKVALFKPLRCQREVSLYIILLWNRMVKKKREREKEETIPRSSHRRNKTKHSSLKLNCPRGYAVSVSDLNHLHNALYRVETWQASVELSWRLISALDVALQNAPTPQKTTKANKQQQTNHHHHQQTQKIK